ncbi:autotransporter outer membrane beta-barrel domain-containing protein [Achromobacter xylosoxidans]
MLTIDGDLVVQPGGRYLVEADPAGSGADRVHVTGNATLNGGSVVHIGANGNYGLRASYTIMEVDGALSGRFDTVSSDFAFLTPSLAYDYGAGRVSLNLSRNETRMASRARRATSAPRPRPSTASAWPADTGSMTPSCACRTMRARCKPASIGCPARCTPRPRPCCCRTAAICATP